MTSVTLITHMHGRRPELLKRAVKSIEDHWVPGINHKVIETHTYIKSRFDSVLEDEYVAFVDDDDTLNNDVLRRVMAAIETYDKPGLVFTSEAYVKLDGTFDHAQIHNHLHYSQIAAHPRTAHHLAVFKTSYITEALDLHYQFGGDDRFGALEWIMKAEAALKGGAVYIPIVGYNYTIHDTNMCAEPNWIAIFNKHMIPIGDRLRAMRPQDGPVPTNRFD